MSGGQPQIKVVSDSDSDSEGPPPLEDVPYDELDKMDYDELDKIEVVLDSDNDSEGPPPLVEDTQTIRLVRGGIAVEFEHHFLRKDQVILP